MRIVLRDGWLKKSIEESRKNVSKWPEWKRKLQDTFRFPETGKHVIYE